MSVNSRYQNEKNKKVYFLNSNTGQFIETKNYRDFKDIEIEELIKLEDNKIKNTLLYNDCTDLKLKEIELLALWNEFMDSYQFSEKNEILANTEDLLKKFIEENMDYIKEKEMINELMLFMNYLVNKDEISFNFFFEWSIKIN